MSKYHNQKTLVDGIMFDSKKEANRYCELKILLKKGKIFSLECHPKFPLSVNECLIGTYIADFSYTDYTSGGRGLYGFAVVEDVKGVKTAVYRLKKKLMKAIYGIDIYET